MTPRQGPHVGSSAQGRRGRFDSWDEVIPTSDVIKL